MIRRLVARYLALRPVRSLVFVGGYAAGVAVMLSLLSIGEVMVEQARDEEWIGGGDIVVLPAGVDLETLRLGGAVFYGIEGSRFLARSILTGPRLADRVEAVAPWIEDRPLYVRAGPDAEPVPVRAMGMIPSAAWALGAAPDVVEGSWSDSEADRRWLRPDAYALYAEIDRFHRPPGRVRGDTTWAEWHYFNLLWPDQDRWLYLSYILGGDVTGDRWGGVVLARYHTPSGERVFTDTLEASSIRFRDGSPDLELGPHAVRLERDPVRYRVRTGWLADVGAGPDEAPADAGRPGVRGPGLRLDLELIPEPHRYFPPVEIAASDAFVSGYVVPALRARARGRLCLDGRCEPLGDPIGYHDHNWGTWSGVVWDWGVAHAGDLDVLYGGVHGEGADEARRRGVRFLAYVVDSLGVAGTLQLESLEYSGGRPLAVDGSTVRVPETLSWTATRGTDSLTVRILLGQTSLSRVTPVDGSDEGATVYFAQMRGVMRIRGVLGDRQIDEEGPGFFETYLRD